MRGEHETLNAATELGGDEKKKSYSLFMDTFKYTCGYKAPRPGVKWLERLSVWLYGFSVTTCLKIYWIHVLAQRWFWFLFYNTTNLLLVWLKCSFFCILWSCHESVTAAKLWALVATDEQRRDDMLMRWTVVLGGHAAEIRGRRQRTVTDTSKQQPWQSPQAPPT